MRIDAAAGFGLVLGAALAIETLRGPTGRTARRTAVAIAFSVLAAAAVGWVAVETGASPTGHHVADVVVTIAFSAVLAASAHVARTLPLAGTAVALVAVVCLRATPSSRLVFALAGIGVLAALARRRVDFDADRSVSASAAGCFSDSCVAVALAATPLFLPTSLPARVPSFVAACFFAVVVVSAVRTLRPVARWSAGIVAFAVLGAAAAVTVGAARSLAAVRTDAQHAFDLSSAALRELRDGNRSSAAASLPEAAAAIDSVRGALQHRAVRFGRYVPILGQHIRALDDVTAVSKNLVADATQASDATSLRGILRPGPVLDLAAVGRLDETLFRTRQSILDARATLRTLRNPWLAAPLTSKLATLDALLERSDAQTEGAAEFVSVLPALVGGEEPRRYLLVLPTPAEARGSGGLIGSYGVIEAKGGALHLVGLQRHLPPESSPSGPFPVVDANPEFLARYGRFGVNSQTLVNVTMSPDFPSVARAAASLYPQIGGTAVDGVISVDPIGLEALLAITGPVRVDGWDEPIGGSNARRVLLHDAYARLGGDTPERASLLSQVALTSWSSLSALPDLDPSKFIAGLGPAAQRRHLQVWLRRPEEQSYVHRRGLSGALPEVADGDAFGVVVNNASGNKIDYFLTRTISYQVDLRDNQRDTVVTIALRNAAPPNGEPEYVIGNEIKVNPPPPGTNRTYLSLYAPRPLASIRVDDVDRPVSSVEVDAELGYVVSSVWLDLPPNSVTTVVARWSEQGQRPASNGVKVFTQPLANSDELRVSIVGPNGVATIQRSSPMAVEYLETVPSVQAGRPPK